MNPLKNKLWFNFMCLGIALVAFTGCKNNEAGSAVLEGNTTISAESTACFAQYKTELMKMLTKDEIQSVYQGDMTESELKSDIKDSYSSSASYSYWWPGEEDRLKRIMGNGRDLGPMHFRIGAGELYFYKEDSKFILKQFENTYALIEDKKADAKEAISQELEDNGDESITKNTSRSIAKSIIPELKFTPVENVGDAAVWSHINNSLIVLSGKAKFTVFVDVSDNHQENVDLSEKLAKIILDKCE